MSAPHHDHVADGDTDAAFVGRALGLAERGRPTARPNPLVGAVLVRDGRIVGEGWHERPGGPHAEIVALGGAGEAARGATLYVTMEPCDHRGRTPPCTRALLAAGVRRVVYGARDPNPIATGGSATLAARGIEVRGGVRADEVRAQNEPFFSVHERGRPVVTLKLAQSLDGRAAAADRSSRWLTSSEARRAVHELRAASDAVLVGSGTVLADDPELTVRGVDAPRGQPTPVVLDTRGRTPSSARVVRPGAVIVTTPASSAGWRAALTEAGADVVVVGDRRGQVPPDARGGVDLGAALEALAARDLQTVLVEGGPTVAGALLRARLVDRLILHVAPMLLGAEALSTTGSLGVQGLDQALRFQLTDVRRLGSDIELIAVPGTSSASPDPASARGTTRTT